MHRAGDMIRSSFIPGRGCPGIASVHAMACRAPKVRCAGLSIAIPVCPNHQDVDGAIVRFIDKGNRAAFGKRERSSTEVAWPHREVLSRAGASIAGRGTTGGQKSKEQNQKGERRQLLHSDIILSRKRAFPHQATKVYHASCLHGSPASKSALPSAPGTLCVYANFLMPSVRTSV